MSSLENALAILGLLSRERPVLRVGEVCRELGLPKSSASRLLRAMAERGLIERAAADFGYSVGPLAFQLGGLYTRRFSAIDTVEHAVDALVTEFGFTGYAASLSGANIVLLHVRQGSYPLRHVRDVGTSLPARSTAMGQALLARLSDDQIEARLDGRDGVAGLPALLRALRPIRRTGVIVAASVLTPGITTIATAVRDPASDSAIAFALAWPDSAANHALRQRMRERVLATARAVGQQAKDPFWHSLPADR